MYTSKKVQKIAKAEYPKYVDQYDYIGIRVQEGTYGVQVGQTVSHCSSVWDDGKQTGALLDGICAVNAKIAAQYNLGFGAYSGDTVMILGSNYVSYGEDDSEIIMRNPTVLAIIA